MTDIGIKQQIYAGNQQKGAYNTKEQRRTKVNEFRRTHFIFGKHPTIHYSQAKYQQLAGAGKAGGRQGQENSAIKNQATNFSIGAGMPKHLQYGTIYDTITGKARGWSAQRTKQGDITAKRCSVQLGRGMKYGFTTTNSRVYPSKDPYEAIVPPNTDFIHTIKSSHFDIGTHKARNNNEIKQHYLSAANLSHNHKGNAMKVKAVLDEKKKQDLRTNHFGIGGPTADFKLTMSTLQYRPSTANQRTSARPSLTAAKKRDLKGSHWSIGQVQPDINLSTIRPGHGRNSCAARTIDVTDSRQTAAGQRPGSAFVTSSMVNFKWVQPVVGQ